MSKLTRRIYPFGHRLHHGTIGLGLIAAGLALCWDDRKDARVWISGWFQDRR